MLNWARPSQVISSPAPGQILGSDVDDVGLARPEALDLLGVGVDADQPETFGAGGHQERNADVAEADHGHGGRAVGDGLGQGGEPSGTAVGANR